MSAHYLTIESKHRRWIGLLASMADFTCQQGEEVSAEIVLTSPTISLYCLDEESQCAIFVELPADVNLTTVPFVFQTQYEQAQRLIAVPYSTFLQLAHTLPALSHLIVVYMLPRSGSTLVSHLLNAVDGVVSLSEPDAPMHLIDIRQTHSRGEASLRELLDATMRFLFKPGVWRTPETCAFKTRLEGLLMLDLVQATFLARENPSEGNQMRLSDEEVAQITRILERHPVIKTSDFVLPGTLQV